LLSLTTKRGAADDANRAAAPPLQLGHRLAN